MKKDLTFHITDRDLITFKVKNISALSGGLTTTADDKYEIFIIIKNKLATEIDKFVKKVININSLAGGLSFSPFSFSSSLFDLTENVNGYLEFSSNLITKEDLNEIIQENIEEFKNFITNYTNDVDSDKVFINFFSSWVAKNLTDETKLLLELNN